MVRTTSAIHTAPTFEIKGKNKQGLLTVAVNHFKSKGSKCWEDAAPIDEGGQGGQDVDQQGSCENFRVAAAVALGEALEDIPGHKVILGDLNAYGKEDPMLVLTDYSQKQYGKVIKAARNILAVLSGVEQFGESGRGYSSYLDKLWLHHINGGCRKASK